MTPDDDVLLQRYLDGALAPGERRDLAARLRADGTLADAFRQGIENANLVDAALRAPGAAVVADAVRQALRLRTDGHHEEVSAAVRLRLGRSRRRRWRLRLGLAGSAAAAAMLVLGTLLLGRAPSAPVTDPVLVPVTLTDGLAIEAESDRDITLADGSHLRFTSGSRASLRDSATGVVCNLDRGEVTAQVEHQPAGRRLRVATTHAVIEVVGTRFSVATGSATRIAVDEGLVLVRRRDGTQCHVPGGFTLSCAPGVVTPPEPRPQVDGVVPRLGVTWADGRDPLPMGPFTLLATKRRHWPGVGGQLPSPAVAATWKWSDQLYAAAEGQRTPVLQNAFFWGDWVRPGRLDPAAGRAAASAWSAAAIARYGGRMGWWEVVDERLAEPDYAAAFGGAGVSGYDWLIALYRLARAQAPQVRLTLGGLERLGVRADCVRFVAMARALAVRGLVDGLTVAAHDLRDLAPEALQANLDLLANTGLPILIEEFDIDIADDQAQAAAFSRIFPLFWTHPAVRVVSFWGIRQGASLRSNDHLIDAAGVERPALRWLRGYLRSDAVRVAILPDRDGASTLVLRRGAADAAITRVEVDVDGKRLAAPATLPAVAEMPPMASGSHTVVVRAMAGERVVSEISRSVTVP